MAATQKSVHIMTLDRERVMMAIEFAKALKEGKLEVKKLHRFGRSFYLYLGHPSRYPDTYTIDKVKEDILVVTLGTGDRRVMKRKNDAYILIPSSLVKNKDLKPGPVLIEWIDENKFLLYVV